MSKTISVNPRVNPSAVSDVVGITEDAGNIGVIGSNIGNNSFGFLAGDDLVFNQHAGVYGESDQQGVMGLATKDSGTGVYGGGASHAGAPGAGSIGVRGETFSGTGVQGRSFGSGVGVRGDSAQNDGVAGVAHVGNKSGVFGFNDADGVGVGGFSKSGIGVVGQGGALAGKFVGDIEVTGHITTNDVVLAGGDCAEDFNISGTEKIEPGTVMVIDQHGALKQSQQAYDKRVAGVVSGAGDLRPGIILDKQQSQSNRMPIALLGKVYCKVDAQYAPVEVGDLLTTSPTPGHGMKASDPLKAFGSVIGKALRPLKMGQGLIPILIALQ